MSDWRTFKQPPLPASVNWYMWGMFVWGVGLGAVITYVFVHTFEGAGLDHWSRLLGITIFWTGFWFFMRGKYVAWRAAQQLPPPDASS